MKFHLTLLFISIILPLSGENDYEVKELPYYKMSQKEKEDSYKNSAEAFISSKNSLEASRYISSTDPEEVAEFTKAYKKYHKRRTGPKSDDLIIFGGKGNQFANITMETESKVRSVCQMIWEKEMDLPKVDWRATYGYSETPWEEFFETKPQIPTLMRVRLAKSDYYNFKYSDDKVWACLKCYHPFLKKELFAYIKFDSPKSQKILKAVNSKGFTDVTVELSYPDEVKDWKQVEISNVLRHTWYRKNY